MLKLKDELLDGLLEKYGEEEQLLQTMGECGELIAVTQNYLRAKKFGHRTETLDMLLEEAVDVFFMVQQVRRLCPQLFDYIALKKEKQIIKKFEDGNIK